MAWGHARQDGQGSSTKHATSCETLAIGGNSGALTTSGLKVSGTTPDCMQESTKQGSITILGNGFQDYHNLEKHVLEVEGRQPLLLKQN